MELVEIPVIKAKSFVTQSFSFTYNLSSHKFHVCSSRLVFKKVRYRNTTYIPLNSQSTYVRIHTYNIVISQNILNTLLRLPFYHLFINFFGIHYKNIITLIKFFRLVLVRRFVSVFHSESVERIDLQLCLVCLPCLPVHRTNEQTISARNPSSTTFLRSESDQSEYLGFPFQSFKFYCTSSD